MRVRAVILALALSPVPAAAQHAFPEAPRGEIGLRYWGSSGESKRSHSASGLGNPSSVVTYENLDANALEVLGRLGQTWFIKGNAGLGRINVGEAIAQDFAVGQVPIAQATTAVTGGRLGYWSADVGREWTYPGRGRTTLGAFIGFGQWGEEVEVDTFSNETTWSALRIGLAADLLLGPDTRLAIDFAVVPYAEVREEDNRGTRIEGRGTGIQIDLELRYMLRPRTELRAGARAWYLEATDGTHNAPGSSLVEVVSTRTGLTLSLRQLW
jgi:hypothetical protein